MMKSKLTSILLLSLSLCFIACKPEPPPEQINYPAFTPTPKPVVNRVYKEPEVGMGYLDFDKLCNPTEVNSEDDYHTYESARGKTVTIRLEYTSKRSKSKCWGTFTFTGNTLDSIFRH